MSSNRTILRDGIAQYLGGTFVAEERAWQNGPLVSSGLGTVRAAFPKGLADQDMFAMLPVGRAMGAFMVVRLGPSKNVRRSVGGKPVVTSGTITTGGIRFRTYRVLLEVFHIAQAQYAEDEQQDLDDLLYAIEYLIMEDPTLGGICTQAGEGRFGIEIRPGLPAVDPDRGRTGTWAQIEFEVLTQELG